MQKINEQLVKKVQDREACIEHTRDKNDFTLLQQVVSSISNDLSFLKGKKKFYFKTGDNRWDSSNFLPFGNMESIPLKDFFVEEVEEKDVDKFLIENGCDPQEIYTKGAEIANKILSVGSSIKPAPCRVKILKCSYEQGWYKHLIGEEFDVDLASGSKDYVLWEDYCGGYDNTWRHISKEDCEIVPSPSEPVDKVEGEGYANDLFVRVFGSTENKEVNRENIIAVMEEYAQHKWQQGYNAAKEYYQELLAIAGEQVPKGAFPDTQSIQSSTKK